MLRNHSFIGKRNSDMLFDAGFKIGATYNFNPIKVSQPETKKEFGEIGVSFMLGEQLGDSNLFGVPTSQKATKFNAASAYGFNIDYWYPVSKGASLYTGIQYTKSGYELYRKSSSPEEPDLPPITDAYVSILTIPVGVQIGFLKYLFFNSGVLLDIDLGEKATTTEYRNIDKQNGLGFFFGLGLKYEFKNGIGVYINPMVRNHTVFGRYNSDPLSDAGFKIGVTYNLNPVKKY